MCLCSVFIFVRDIPRGGIAESCGNSIFHFFFLINLFLAALGLCCGVRASHCCGFSCGPWALGARASVVAARGLSSCGAWA